MDLLYQIAACQVACTQQMPLLSPTTVTHSPPEPLHTDLHSAFSLPPPTSKTKVSRTALRLGGGVSLAYNACYTSSERKKVCMW